MGVYLEEVAGVQFLEANSGEVNSGEVNSVEVNFGEVNSGEVNSGEVNSGEVNSGEANSVEVNSEEANSGVVELVGANFAGTVVHFVAGYLVEVHFEVAPLVLG